MEKAFTSFLLFFHLVVASLAITYTNITTDQSALLFLKSQIISDPFHLLDESWSPAISVCHWVGVTCNSRHQRVMSLNISNMALTGRIPPYFGNLTFLVSLDLSSNNFYGNLPQEMVGLRRLRTVRLSFNNFNGEVPSWFGVLHQLQYLALRNNSFSGSIPSLFSNISTLRVLDLTYNSLEGQIPKEIGKLENLWYLSLYGNKLIGSIPPSLSNASLLVTLSLSLNFLQGNIPQEIGKLQNLNHLSIAFNQLTGSIPFSIFNISGIEVIAFTNNTLSGNLPPDMCDHLPMLEGLYLSSNELRGHMPLSLSNCSKLQILSLSANEFDGPIYSEIGQLSNLQMLYLGQNHFEGTIPQEIGILGNLVNLGLERNQLTGLIPKSLEKLLNLKYFNVSFNKLVGEIPSGGPFKNLSIQSFMSNEALCGSPRFHVPPCHTTTSKHRSKRKRVLILILPATIALVLVSIAFALVWIRYIRGKRTDTQQAIDSSSVVSTRERISYYELLRATDSLSESNLIGSGSFSSVYKGFLRDGTPIAAKVFNLQLQAAFRSFDTECQVLRNLRHRNLTKVITSCSNLEFKALVLEYMPNGSLDKWLYSHNYFLDMKHRLSIMIDVACALEYLHHDYSLPVIHCDLKPSNVLLDEDLVAHLSDFGISKLLYEDESASYTKTLATLGYIAPEYGLEGLVSTKCDVYSYGIMLMETFTRTKPYDEKFDGDLSLKQWVSNSLPRAVMEVVDANLITPHDNHLMKKLDCAESIMKVAMDCCVESPKGRIDMKDVVTRLKTIKIQLLTC